MSGSGQNHPSSGQGNVPQAAGGDPSMEDILASIRRILSEDDGSTARKGAPGTAAAPDAKLPDAKTPVSPVFSLDESMLVREPVAAPNQAQSSLAALGSFMSAASQPAAVPAAPVFLAPVPPLPEQKPAMAEPPVMHEAQVQAEHAVAVEEPQHSTTLVAPEAAAAAAASMGTLMRTLTAERHTSVYRGGPTLEDMVRDEMRPMLKEWLDANVPAMVERIVRSEIERMAGRVAF